ncbi:nuclear factor NF-kappa-B p100 subunit-like [Narcine bancroftii]|uniref:nuclear factor NF-kappa-B p100 subunit-like n=1 Tax=Narcine bancroftii TaxID=1343680 RepID=UPI0038311216
MSPWHQYFLPLRLALPSRNLKLLTFSTPEPSMRTGSCSPDLHLKSSHVWVHAPFHVEIPMHVWAALRFDHMGLSLTLTTQTIRAPPSCTIASLGCEALGELNAVLNQDVSGEDWEKLAEKLDLGSLAELLKSAKSPSKSLLDNFDISGGTIEQLINALQQLGLEKAVNIIQKTEVYKILQSSDGKQSVDSAYGSESQKDICA